MSSPGPPFAIPGVTEADIGYAEGLLGITFDRPRRQVLLCNESIDVQACPGSGKTTLLVAKLTILATKWTEPRRGICVLSHTNVARQEIERTLATSAVGQRLLSYPHFVGTIHGFVNEFLGLPCLRSDGLAVRMINNEACFDVLRSRVLSPSNRKRLGSLAYKTRALERLVRSLAYDGGDWPAKRSRNVSDEQWAVFRETKARTSASGIFYHQDLFGFAARLFSDSPQVSGLIRQRFPVVFIDEMQDTSEMQSRILATVFPAEACELRQRFGDSNQAIYDYDSGQARATTDPFPSPQRVREIRDSKRFGPTIASLADPLAFEPINPSLAGQGPPVPVSAGACEGFPNTVFLFGPDSCHAVLPAFAALLMSVFPDADLRGGLFRAVGHRGKKADSSNNPPRSLHDYWAEYQPEVARTEPRPTTLADYFHLAARRRSRREDTAESVEIIAKGLIELAHRIAPGLTARCTFLHRWIEARLNGHPEELLAYRNLLWQRCVEGEAPSRETWPTCVDTVRQLLVPLGGAGWSPEAAEFCEWSETLAKPASSDASSAPAPANVFRYIRDGRSVDIEVGTIHGAKGQTHRATLVLETFYKEHDLTDLLDWLTADRRGWLSNDGTERGDRLRLIFTAMTRPTHLLCLALRREALGPDLDTDPRATALQERGWHLSLLGPGP